MGSFSKQIELFSKKAKANIGEVLTDSVATVGRIAQDRAPEDTGELKESLKVWVNGVLVGEGEKAYDQVLNTAKPGDAILLGWTADHAVKAEYGTSKSQAYFYVHGAAVQWDEIVRQAVARLPNK